jgi:hypothetical protein
MAIAETADKLVKKRNNPKATDKQARVQEERYRCNQKRSCHNWETEAAEIKNSGSQTFGGKGPDFQQEAIFTPHFSSILPEHMTQPTTHNKKTIARMYAAKSAKFREGEGNKNKILCSRST